MDRSDRKCCDGGRVAYVTPSGRRAAVITAEQQGGRDRIDIITGAGGGLGSAVARLLAGNGAHRLCLVDHHGGALDAVLADVRAAGAEAIPLQLDLGSPPAAESVVPATLAAFGRVDALVNAAAILNRRELDQVTQADFDRVCHVNTLAPLLLARAAMRDMAP